jgi:hypothetical protein
MPLPPPKPFPPPKALPIAHLFEAANAIASLGNTATAAHWGELTAGLREHLSLKKGVATRLAGAMVERERQHLGGRPTGGRNRAKKTK